MMIDTQDVIALIRTRQEKQLALGMADGAAVNAAIVAEYDALLAEIEQHSVQNRFARYRYNAEQSRRTSA